MIIKKLTKRNLNDLYKLGKPQFKGQEWYDMRFLKETIESEGYHYGVFEKSKMLGAIDVVFQDKPKVWIYFFVVDKNYRKRGIGSKLLEKVEKKLQKNFFLIFVDFEKNDYSAIRFYKKHRFKEQAKIKNWFGIRHDGLIYSKIIKKK